MNFLLDTHAFIWWATAPSKLSEHAQTACQDRSNRLLLSVASLWEMQIKLQLGKLTLSVPLDQLVMHQLQVNGLQLLPIEAEHVYAISGLPQHHRDPFDRLIIAQAIVEHLTLITADAIFSRYPVTLSW